jgi:Protein of unknown function (DUF2934)
MADIRLTSTQGKKPAAAKGAAKKAAAPASGKVTEITAASKTISKKNAASSPSKVDTHSKVTVEERRKMIAEAAFIRAERRGFVGGDPNDDWLAAEREIDQILSRT